MQRKYVGDLRPEIPNELFVRIEHEGQFAFFPLSTNKIEQATSKAVAIRKAVTNFGWAKGQAKFVREITLAVFWMPNPLVCSYTSLFTALRAPKVNVRSGQNLVRVALHEPDDQVRWGLMCWLNSIPGYCCVEAFSSAELLLRGIPRIHPDFVIYDDPPCGPASENVREKLAGRFFDLPAFAFGIYSDSEHAWHCVTGVDGGYYWRRRRPEQMMEPVSGLWKSHKPTLDAVESQIRNHVQTLFGLRAAVQQAFPGLTVRERDVLAGLRRGHTDKTIATLLNISVWTVHTHIKSLFHKLGVHTRTEAAAKFFEK